MKKIVAISLAIMFVLTLFISTLAPIEAEANIRTFSQLGTGNYYTLGEFDWRDDDFPANQGIWSGEKGESETRWSEIRNAKYLFIRITNEPVEASNEETFMIGYVSGPDWNNWKDVKYKIDEVCDDDDDLIIIDLSDLDGWEDFADGEDNADFSPIQLVFAYWGGTLDSLGITGVWLTDDASWRPTYEFDLGNPDDGWGEAAFWEGNYGQNEPRLEAMTNATKLIVSMSEEPSASEITLFMNNESSGWNNVNFETDTHFTTNSPGIFTINLASVSFWSKYSNFQYKDDGDNDWLQIGLASWGNNSFEDILESAKVIGNLPGGMKAADGGGENGGGENGGENGGPPTPTPTIPPGGDDEMEFFVTRYDLGPMTDTNDVSAVVNGWVTDGTDNKTTGLSSDTVFRATDLVLQVTEVDIEASIALILGAPGVSWWAQELFIIEDIFDEETNKITISLVDHPRWDDFKNNDHEDNHMFKLLIGYWDDKVADLGITEAYLIGKFPVPPPSIDDNIKVADGVATITMSEQDIDMWLQFGAQNDDLVIWNVAGFEGVTTVRLPNNALTAFAEAELSLRVAIPYGIVTIPANALLSIVKEADGEDIDFSITRPTAASLPEAQSAKLEEGDAIFSITLKVGDTNITTFDGYLEFTVPYTGDFPVKAWHLAADGTLEEMDVVRTNSTGTPPTVTFRVPHLSVFIIRHDETGTTADKNGVVVFLGIAGLVAAGSGAGIITIRRKLK
ncbi:MAG: hypothetical protein LBC71_00215 [Oscillospiraceae bacterium]|jgi:hypothetical protein|nr:hypothetical protein [Oscillospiraceae bacterium]